MRRSHSLENVGTLGKTECLLGNLVSLRSHVILFFVCEVNISTMSSHVGPISSQGHNFLV